MATVQSPAAALVASPRKALGTMTNTTGSNLSQPGKQSDFAKPVRPKTIKVQPREKKNLPPGKQMAKMASEQVKKDTRNSSIKSLRMSWQNQKSHLGVQGPLEDKRGIQNAYSHTPSRKFMEGRVQGARKSFLGKENPPSSPSSRPAIKMQMFGSATKAPQSATNIKPETPEPVSKPTTESPDAVEEPSWDDQFSFKMSLSPDQQVMTPASDLVKNLKTPPKQQESLRAEIESEYEERMKQQQIENEAREAEFEQMLRTREQQYEAEKKALQAQLDAEKSAQEAAKVEDSTPSDDVARTISPTRAKYQKFEQLHALDAKHKVIRHHRASMEERLHCLLSGKVQSQLEGDKEVISVMMQIGAQTRDIDMLEQKMGMLGQEVYGLDPIPTTLATVGAQSSLLAGRLNARIKTGIPGAGSSFKRPKAQEQQASIHPKALAQVESVVNEAFMKQKALLQRTHDKLKQTQAHLAKVDAIRQQHARDLHNMSMQIDTSMTIHSEKQTELAHELFCARQQLVDRDQKLQYLLRNQEKQKRASMKRGSLRKRLTRSFSKSFRRSTKRSTRGTSLRHSETAMTMSSTPAPAMAPVAASNSGAVRYVSTSRRASLNGSTISSRSTIL